MVYLLPGLLSHRQSSCDPSLSSNKATPSQHHHQLHPGIVPCVITVGTLKQLGMLPVASSSSGLCCTHWLPPQSTLVSSGCQDKLSDGGSLHHLKASRGMSNHQTLGPSLLILWQWAEVG